MNAIHNYYERLFGNRDAELEHKNIEDLLQTDQIPKLTDFQKESIEGKLTITEIGNALKKRKMTNLQDWMASILNFLNSSGPNLNILYYVVLIKVFKMECCPRL